LRLPVRVAQFNTLSGMSDRVAKPEFATSIGLMMADLTYATENPSTGKRAKKAGESTGGQAARKLFKSASDLLKKFKT
jgi:cell division ATPase FtsA